MPQLPFHYIAKSKEHQHIVDKVSHAEVHEAGRKEPPVLMILYYEGLKAGPEAEHHLHVIFRPAVKAQKEEI